LNKNVGAIYSSGASLGISINGCKMPDKPLGFSIERDAN